MSQIRILLSIRYEKKVAKKLKIKKTLKIYVTKNLLALILKREFSYKFTSNTLEKLYFETWI